MNLSTKISSILVNDPTNYKEIGLKVDVDPETLDKVVAFDGNLNFGTGDLRYANDAYSLLDSIMMAGVTGGNGVAEAVPITLEVDEFGRKIVLLDALLNLWEGSYNRKRREISAPLIQRGGNDWLAKNTEGLSFEYLKAIGKINNSDIILAPYVIEKQNQNIEKITAILTGLVVVTQIRQQITEIQEIVADTASASPWVAVAKVAIRVAYITILLKSLLDTTIRLVNLLIQPVKYVAGMTVKRHFEIIFEHLGFKFESTIFDGDEKFLTIFPEKYSNPTNKDYDDILGWIIPDKSKQNGFYKGYAFQFCQTFREYYNAKFIVDQNNNIVRFERRDYVGVTGNFTPPNLWEDFTLNRQDFIGNHLFSFQTDINDRHTIQEFSGVSSQVNISLKSVNQQYSLTDKGKIISIPFALFKIKTELSQVEKILKTTLEVIDIALGALVTVVNVAIKAINAILGLINKILKALKVIGIKLNVNLPKIPELKKVSLSQAIKDRVGIFKMEDDIVYSPKIAYVKPSSSDKNTRQLKELRAQDVQENYHAVDFFTRGNQWLITEEFDIPVNFYDIYDIIDSDEMADGSQLISLDWKVGNNTATIQLRKPFTYLSGCLEEKQISPDGS